MAIALISMLVLRDDVAVGHARTVTHAFAGALFDCHAMRVRLSQKVLLPAFFITYIGESKAADPMRGT